MVRVSLCDESLSGKPSSTYALTNFTFETTWPNPIQISRKLPCRTCGLFPEPKWEIGVEKE